MHNSTHKHSHLHSRTDGRSTDRRGQINRWRGRHTDRQTDRLMEKFDCGLRHDDLHRLDVPERVKFKLVSMVHNCLHHKAPRYLTDYCVTNSDVISRRRLRSARRHYLVVPRHSLSLYGRRAFAVAGPTVWKALSDDLHDPTLSTDSFRRLLKTRLFMRYINSRLTYFVTDRQSGSVCISK